MKHNVKGKNTIAWLALFIALFGGIPGAVNLIKDIWSTNVDIAFKDKPLAGTILSNSHTRNGKPGVFFYKVSFVGKGEKPTTIRSVDLYLGFDDEWKKGVYFAPVTNSYKGLEKWLFTGTVFDNILVGEWDNFLTDTEAELPYGRQHTYCLGFYFEETLPPFETCNKWKIVVFDVFGNKYQFTKDSPLLSNFKKGADIYIFDINVDSPDDLRNLIKAEKSRQQGGIPGRP